jgi:hypothetical protein
VHLTPVNFITGVTSFWNLGAPAISLAVLVIGFLVWGPAKQRNAARAGVALLAVGAIALVVSMGSDIARNVHDAHELESAAHDRYGVTVGFADAVALLDSSNVTQATVDGQAASEYGRADLATGGETVTAYLDRLADGSFVLATNGEELTPKS